MNLQKIIQRLFADTTLSHYRLLAKLAAGGIGEVKESEGDQRTRFKWKNRQR